jgi:uncharacterized protein YcfJ
MEDHLPNTKTVLAATLALAAATSATAQVTLYSREDFHGAVTRVDERVWNLERAGFNDRASSVIVDRGRWEVCEHARFEGRCVVLGPGAYPTLATFGLNNAISSLRPARDVVAQVPPPPPAPLYEYRRRPSERLFEADVVAVRAVVGPPEQRCWIERREVVEYRPDAPNVPGAIAGAIIGGILGHQVGAGHGRDAATALGAVGGAAVGANIGRGGQVVRGQDVQRCATAPGNVRPAYWDVTYEFRGVTHRAQMSATPGATITVNGRGEPRE